jgi:hypothetical protein
MKVKIVEEKRKLSELLALEAELNGVYGRDTQNKVVVYHQGLRNFSINTTAKYWLKKLSDKLEKEKKSFEELKLELFNKYGEERDSPKGTEIVIEELMPDPEDKEPTIKAVTDEEKAWKQKTIPNPAFDLFRKEEKDLLDQEVAINLPKFNVEDLFTFESEHNFNTCYELLILEEEVTKD